MFSCAFKYCKISLDCGLLIKFPKVMDVIYIRFYLPFSLLIKGSKVQIDVLQKKKVQIDGLLMAVF
jgi:hypothetical protein